jgi:hypothetical protein
VGLEIFAAHQNRRRCRQQHQRLHIDGEGVDDAMKPFSGYGRVSLRANPDAALPDGVPWPITIVPDGASYQEGS